MPTSKLTLSVSFLLALGSLHSKAAIFVVSNVGDLLTDTLYAYEDNSLMNPTDGGVVTVGYFGAGVDLADIDTLGELHTALSGFTVMSTATPGAAMVNLGNLAVNGYADNSDSPTSNGPILTGNPLIDRKIFSISTNAASIAAAALAPLDSNLQLGLVEVGTIVSEDSGELTYSSNPLSIPIIGSNDTITDDLGFGNSTYNTFKMASIPEPSTTLLVILGSMAVLRRRRSE